MKSFEFISFDWFRILTLIIFSFSFISLVSSSPICLDQYSLCVEPFEMNGYYYCDIDDTVVCPKEWDSSRSLWLGGCLDGACYTEEADSEPFIPECSDGYQECRNDKVYECDDGEWDLIEICSDECVEQTYNYAYCDFTKYYCQGVNSCYFSSVKGSNCYDSLEDCEQNLIVWCIDKEKGICYKERGDLDNFENSEFQCFQQTRMTQEKCDILAQEKLIDCSHFIPFSSDWNSCIYGKTISGVTTFFSNVWNLLKWLIGFIVGGLVLYFGSFVFRGGSTAYKNSKIAVNNLKRK